MWARTLGALVGAASASCAVAPLVDALQFDGRDQGAVLVIEAGSERRFFGIDPRAPMELPGLLASNDEPLRLTLLTYDEPLDRLGFGLNRELFASASVEGTRLLRPWARASRRVITLDDESAWRPSPDADLEVLQTIRITAASACRSYSLRPYTVTPTVSAAAAFTDGADHVIVAYHDASWWRFDRDRVEPLPPPVEGLAATAAVTAPNGASYVAGKRGERIEVWRRGAPGEAFSELPPIEDARLGAVPEVVYWLAATSTRVLALTNWDRTLELTEQWRELEHRRPGDRTSKIQGAIAADDRGIAIIHPYAFADGERFVTESGKRTVRVTVTVPHAALWVPGFDHGLFGGNAGYVSRLNRDELTPLVNQPLGERRSILALAPVTSGIWSGVAGFGTAGIGRELYENGEFCDVGGTTSDVQRALPLGGDLLLLGQRFPTVAQMLSGERTPSATLLVRGPPP